LMFGGKKSYELFKRLAPVLLDDPVIRNKDFRTDMDRGEAFQYQFKKLARVRQLVKEDKSVAPDWINYTVFTYPLGGLISSSAHHGMFESFIRNIGSKDQVKLYLDDIMGYRILG